VIASVAGIGISAGALIVLALSYTIALYEPDKPGVGRTTRPKAQKAVPTC
jgi:hypothetical protein